MVHRQEQSDQISAVLWDFAKGFPKGLRPSDSDLEFYSTFLVNSGCTVNQVRIALTELFKSGIEYFPSAPAIYARINPEVREEDKAQLMADNVFQKVLYYGRYNTEKIYEDLSDHESHALSACGGPSRICNASESEIGFIKAQLMKSCKASMAGQNIIKFKKLVAESSEKRKELQSFGNYLEDLS